MIVIWIFSGVVVVWSSLVGEHVTTLIALVVHGFVAVELDWRHRQRRRQHHPVILTTNRDELYRLERDPPDITARRLARRARNLLTELEAGRDPSLEARRLNTVLTAIENTRDAHKASRP